MALADRDQQQRIAIRRRMHDRFGGDVVAGTGPVLDDERLAETLRQPLSRSVARWMSVAPPGG